MDDGAIMWSTRGTSAQHNRTIKEKRAHGHTLSHRIVARLSRAR